MGWGMEGYYSSRCLKRIYQNHFRGRATGFAHGELRVVLYIVQSVSYETEQFLIGNDSTDRSRSD
jgi:hypothetical protein